MAIFGIRHASGVSGEWGGCVSDSVNLLNEHLNPRGRYFYFDDVDVAQQAIGGRKVFDMYGWVINGD